MNAMVALVASRCPSEQDLVDYAWRRFASARWGQIDAHVDACRRCQIAVVELLEDSESHAEAPAEASPSCAPLVADRYVIEHVVGEGAMGVVYAARDRVLDRRVALKLIKTSVIEDDVTAATEGSAVSALRSRLVHEARVLAQLDHPNIVTVFDVGSSRQAMFIAMEYIAGKTLRTPVRREGMAWRRVLELLLPAAEALAAAHDRGVVHRDFKPDNVMLSGTTIKVLDFGLASALRKHSGRMRGTMASATAATIAGSPAYMAPESLRGASADRQGDQYAFFVTLFELLSGERPFSAPTLSGLLRAKSEGLAPDGSHCPAMAAWPAWLRRSIHRGLQPDPRARHEDMHVVAAEFRRRLRRSPRMTALRGVAAIAVGLAGASWAASADQPCGAGPEHVEAVWGGGQRRAVARVLREASPSRAGALLAQLHRDMRAWQAVYTRACEATHVRNERSAAEFDATMACLSDRLVAFEDVVDVMRTPGADVVAVVMGRSSLIGDIAGCDALPSEHVPSDDHRALRQRVARSKILQRAGQRAQARMAAAHVGRDAAAAGLADVEAHAAFVEGMALASLHRFVAAEHRLAHAYELGYGAGEDLLAASAAATLGLVVGRGRHRPHEGLRWLRHAAASFRRAGRDPVQSSRYWKSAGFLLEQLARPEQAVVALRRALAASKGDPWLAHTDLGVLLGGLGRMAEAAEHFKRALAAYERSHGPEHPRTLKAGLNYAMALDAMKHHDEALAILEDLERRLEATGTRSALRAGVWSALGVAMRASGRAEQGLAWLRDALALREELGASAPTIASETINLAAGYFTTGHCDDALALSLRAHTLLEEHEEEAGYLQALALHNASKAWRCLGRHEPALAYQYRAIAIFEALDRRPALTEAVGFAAFVAADLGRAREADALAARAIALSRELGMADDERQGLVDLRERVKARKSARRRSRS